MKNRLYVIICNTLDPIYGCVQGSHAVAQWMLDNQDSLKWKNDYLIFLSGDLDDVQWKLNRRSMKYSKFHEPDLDGKLTAIAVHLEDDNKIFSKYKLMSV